MENYFKLIKYFWIEINMILFLIMKYVICEDLENFFGGVGGGWVLNVIYVFRGFDFYFNFYVIMKLCLF